MASPDVQMRYPNWHELMESDGKSLKEVGDLMLCFEYVCFFFPLWFIGIYLNHGTMGKSVDICFCAMLHARLV